MKTTSFAIVCLSIFLTGTADAQVKLGAIGDSLVDEHFDQGIGYSKNALELMITTGRVDAGPLGNWGDTRGTGYQYNWALAASTSSSLLSNNQHTNLANQIPTAGITKAVMVIGANDLFPFSPTGFPPGSAYEAIYEGQATQADIDLYANLAINNVVTAAQTLKATGVDLIVANAGTRLWNLALCKESLSRSDQTRTSQRSRRILEW